MNDRFVFETRAGVGVLSCKLITAPHGFSTRLGGVSRGPFDALNLGASAGDEPASVAENRRRFACALGVATPVVSLHQVHGPVVHAVAGPFDGPAPKGDAVVSRTPGLAVGVFTADCTPILLFDPGTNAVGAVHAGWRGTVAHVVKETVRAMQTAFGADPARMRAAVGPAIGPCCFEVGPEVVAAARQSPWRGVESAIASRQPRPHFDLFAANRDQLVEAGLLSENVAVSGLCTQCRGDWFYSWRRDAGRTGRMQAAIAVPRSETP